VFTVMQRVGRVADDEMYRAFNMGVGMVCAIGPGEVAAFEAHLDGEGERHFRIGSIVPGDRRVLYA
jgi:phosphoribosylformylglycinamidine cyclo-ligase